MSHSLATCERCHKEFIWMKSWRPYVICEASPNDMFARGYALEELDLCPNCTAALERFMAEGGNEVVGNVCTDSGI